MALVESSVSTTTSSFLNAQIKIKNRARWVSEDRRLYYEWDSLHGEIEVYDKRGNHVAVLNADGVIKPNKPAVKGRTIDV